MKNGRAVVEGLRVSHPNWGNGIVSKIDDDDVLVTAEDGREVMFAKDGDEVQRLQAVPPKNRD